VAGGAGLGVGQAGGGGVGELAVQRRHLESSLHRALHARVPDMKGQRVSAICGNDASRELLYVPQHVRTYLRLWKGIEIVIFALFFGWK